MEAESGTVLFARNADTRKYPASLTKIMTLYMVFDALERGKWTLDTRLKASRRAARQPQTNIGLTTGQTITVRTAIRALIVRSANDVATVVAENLAGSEKEFAARMTRKARALGMTRTTFRNASGLPNSKQRSTARDMATLAIAIRNAFPQYYDFFKTTKFTFNGRTYRSHNKLLERYNGADGLKTGYTRASGFNLVTSVSRGSHQLIGVVFGGRSGKRRDRHMSNILNRGWKTVATWPQSTPPPRPQLRPDRTVGRHPRDECPARRRSPRPGWRQGTATATSALRRCRPGRPDQQPAAAVGHPDRRLFQRSAGPIGHIVGAQPHRRFH